MFGCSRAELILPQELILTWS